jgi:hypothetical protein
MCIGPGKKENQLVSKEARTYVRVNKGVQILGKGELLQDVGVFVNWSDGSGDRGVSRGGETHVRNTC